MRYFEKKNSVYIPNSAFTLRQSQFFSLFLPECEPQEKKCTTLARVVKNIVANFLAIFTPLSNKKKFTFTLVMYMLNKGEG